MPKTYIAIDLKSFYASAECAKRGLDPLRTNLVVADPSRSEKTICLAVSPSLKAYGIPSRCRLFEVRRKVREINEERRRKCGRFHGSSYHDPDLRRDPGLRLDYICATPRMGMYIRTSAQVYRVYLRYVAREDIHVYSVDEVFIDATGYLKLYGMSAREFCGMLIHAVLDETGITATGGIGENLYLAKVAMDIEAKHLPADRDGVRIAQLDRMSYREKMWDHTPLTDFWQIGRGIQRRLLENGMRSMGDVARMSLENEDLLYRIFGIRAELLIDHAWGEESCTMADIKRYVPKEQSLSSGQVLPKGYPYEKAENVVREMADELALKLAGKGVCAGGIGLCAGYDIANLQKGYAGGLEKDYYGRTIPAADRGGIRFAEYTCSREKMIEAVMTLFHAVVKRDLLIRRLDVCAYHVVPQEEVPPAAEQLSLLADGEEEERKRKMRKEREERELQEERAILEIRRRFGRNAVLRGNDFLEDATARMRHEQIGGHRA